MNMHSLRNPSEMNMDFEEINLTTKDGIILHCWLIKLANSQNANTIVMFHENFGNIGHRMEIYYNIQQRLGANIFVFDYRGYGKSTGEPSEAGLQIDCDTVMEYILMSSTIDRSKIFIHGKSLGGALAIYVAEKYKYSVIG